MTAANKKEWLLLCGVVVVTLGASLGMLRWLAPQLIGLPVDLRLVQTAEKLPPFYDGVFRASDYNSSEFILNDPVTVSRARPRLPESYASGPHDILGFRNRSVPNAADVIVIGDSQTYGNDVPLEDNWPSRLGARLKEKQANIYSMATGGWGAVQFVEMATKATSFLPQLVIVAFYTGNDSLESFRVAYSLDRFKDLRPAGNLDVGDTPTVMFPPPPETLWRVEFKDGVKTMFSPALRLAANDEHPAVDAGYVVMVNAAREIHRLIQPFGASVIFTIIPTKEFVYSEKIGREGIEPPADYSRLVAAEGKRIRDLAAALRAIPGADYVDVAAALSAAAGDGVTLYPINENGHPVAAGYAVIADKLADAALKKVSSRPTGLVAVRISEDRGLLYLVESGGIWRVPDLERAIRNGWSRDQIQMVSFRALEALPRRGTLDFIDPGRFGPDALR